MIAISASTPSSKAVKPWRMDVSIDSPRHDFDAGEIGQNGKAHLLGRRAGRELEQHPGNLVGFERRLAAADLLHGGAHIGERLEGDEQTALVRADRGLSELAVNGQRPAEEQQLGADGLLRAARR